MLQETLVANVSLTVQQGLIAQSAAGPVVRRDLRERPGRSLGPHRERRPLKRSQITRAPAAFHLLTQLCILIVE